MKLIKGADLTPEQIKEIKRAYIYRWTFENRTRLENLYNFTHPLDVSLLQDDYEWILQHAFYIRKDGQLAKRPKHCESVCMAE